MKYTLTILLFLCCCGALSQESTEPIEVSLEDIKKANERVTEELEKLNKRLRKKLGKQYPDFTVDQLDSLMETSIAQGKEKAKQTIKDTVVNYLQQTKESLLQDLRQTPEKLPVSEEIATNQDAGENEEASSLSTPYGYYNIKSQRFDPAECPLVISACGLTEKTVPIPGGAPASKVTSPVTPGASTRKSLH